MGKLNLGDKAPQFTLESYNAGTIDLEQLIGEQKIVLIFSRYFGCPVCQVDLRHLLKRVDEIRDKGAKVIYITQSGEKVAKEYIEAQNIDFPIVESSKDELYEEYGGFQKLYLPEKWMGRVNPRLLRSSGQTYTVPGDGM